jgi:release factor glutamine methyltransferase
MTSHVTFMGLDFETTEEVLIPRAETELLARTALELLAQMNAPSACVVDMCCGSGNLVCSLAHARAELRAWASDLTDACVALARRNVSRLGLDGRVTVRQGDLFAGLAGAELEGNVDLVVCNPPYISTGRLANESAQLLEGQPREAFDAGPYGLTIHKRVIKEATAFLRPGGFLAIEIGLGQEKQLEHLFARAPLFETPRNVSDASGAPRVVVAQRKSSRAE